MGVKEPWGEGSPWKNSTAFFTYLRGCLRKAWSRNPSKLNLIKKQRKQIPNPNPRGNKETVWGATCSMCNNDFVLKEINVDHIVAAGQLNKTDDIQGFVERLLYVTEDDLRLVCKGCNSALAYSDKHGVSYEEAILIKKAIEVQNSKQDKEWLTERSVKPDSNATKRRAQIINKLKEEQSETK